MIITDVCNETISAVGITYCQGLLVMCRVVWVAGKVSSTSQFCRFFKMPLYCLFTSVLKEKGLDEGEGEGLRYPNGGISEG